ncbi:MAG: carbohydrate-binding protein [Planctomycetes bacterium]|nr:carbohydrate-binding protein [Planctomycetota bacterium]
MKLTVTRTVRAVLAALAAMLATVSTTAIGQDANRQTITVPAISFSDQGGDEVSRSEPKASAASVPEFIHFWYTPGHWLEWTVDGVDAGKYDVTIRYAGRFSVKRNLAVNGETVPDLESFTLPATGSGRQKDGWEQWSEAKLPASVTLAPGHNVLRMTCLDDTSVCVREIVLTASGKPPVTIPAAKFTAQSGGEVQVITPALLGNVGGVWRQSWLKEGQWLQWTVEVPAAGAYGLGLHYRADGYCRLELQANGEKVKGLEDFIPPKTGSLDYYTIGTLPVPVTLRAGKNTLRLTTLGGPNRGVPRFDGMFSLSAIRLTPLADGASPGDNVLTLTTMNEITSATTAKERQTIDPAPLGPPLPKVEGVIALKEGQSFSLGRRKATVTTADTLPYVENEFTKGCLWDNYDNPMLKELREACKLDEVVAPGKDEYEKQIILMKWVWNQWSFGHAQELYNLRNPLWILGEARKEHVFQCMHSGTSLASAMASMGWVARVCGHSTHTWNEVWSNQHRRWILFDATSNLRHERKGVPLSTYEVYHARYVEQADDVTAFSQDGNQYIAPPRQGKTVKLSIYGTNAYVAGRPTGPRARLDIGQDLTIPFDPKEAYYPINQAALALVPDGEKLKVTLGTMTPNFKEFRVRIDGGEWRPSQTAFSWPLRPGKNRLEAVSVNRFGVEGPISTVAIDVGQ